MLKASHDFIILSLDRSHAVEERLEEEERATIPSIVDHYCVRPIAQPFEQMSLLDFTHHIEDTWR